MGRDGSCRTGVLLGPLVAEAAQPVLPAPVPAIRPREAVTHEIVASLQAVLESDGAAVCSVEPLTKHLDRPAAKTLADKAGSGEVLKKLPLQPRDGLESLDGDVILTAEVKPRSPHLVNLVVSTERG